MRVRGRRRNGGALSATMRKIRQTKGSAKKKSGNRGNENRKTARRSETNTAHNQVHRGNRKI